MSRPAPPAVFSAARHRARRDRAAPGFGEYDFLHRRLSSALVERLADTPRAFGHALDLGAGTGGLAADLLASGRVSSVTALEASPAMAARARRAGLEAVVGDPEALPFAPERFDLVASVLALHWVNDLPGALIQVRQVLKPDGLFLGCLAGAGTLGELRTALIAAETEITGGAAPRVSPLPGLQDMAGLLQRAGLALPVADVDHLTVRYDNLFALLRDVKGAGESAAFAAPGRPLRRDVLARAAAIYAERFSDPDGRVRASVEVIWLSGWAPHDSQPKPKRPGSARVRLADALGAGERSAGEPAAPARPSSR